MQTCTVCSTLSPDEATICSNCHSDLREVSVTAATLKRLQANPRVMRVRISVMQDGCPACRQVEGTYEKDRVPQLPVEGCSHALGCRCFYQPVLDEIYP